MSRRESVSSSDLALPPLDPHLYIKQSPPPAPSQQLSRRNTEPAQQRESPDKKSAFNQPLPIKQASNRNTTITLPPLSTITQGSIPSPSSSHDSRSRHNSFAEPSLKPIAQLQAVQDQPVRNASQQQQQQQQQQQHIQPPPPLPQQSAIPMQAYAVYTSQPPSDQFQYPYAYPTPFPPKGPSTMPPEHRISLPVSYPPPTPTAISAPPIPPSSYPHRQPQPPPPPPPPSFAQPMGQYPIYATLPHLEDARQVHQVIYQHPGYLTHGPYPGVHPIQVQQTPNSARHLPPGTSLTIEVDPNLQIAPQIKKISRRRTRTGCLTCRKRRIKCDERKPHCLNCEKSRKVCLGYEVPPFQNRGKKEEPERGFENLRDDKNEKDYLKTEDNLKEENAKVLTPENQQGVSV